MPTYKFYFLLQFNLLKRRISDFGIHPLLGGVFSVLGFIFLGNFLIQSYQFGSYLVCAIGLLLVSKLASKNRIEFLRMVYNSKQFNSIRLFENALVVLPFVVILIYYQEFMLAAVSLLLSQILVITKLSFSYNFTIPTPFFNRPFEFIVGFRKSYYLLPVVFALPLLGFSVNNANLSIASLLLLTLIALSYYAEPENEFYVWSFALSPVKFLVLKIKVAIRNFSFLLLPLVALLVLLHPDQYGVILGFAAVAIAYLITIVVAKYVSYPNPMALPYGIVLVLSLFFPPLLIGLFPYFLALSKKQLANYLS